MEKKNKGGEKAFKKWKAMNCPLLLQVAETINFHNTRWDRKVDNEPKALIETKLRLI